MILKGYFFSIIFAFICLLLSALLYRIGLPRKYCRKTVHILVGFEWFILYHFFGAGLHFTVVCVVFLAILALTYKSKLMYMISSDADNSPGTVYYALAMTGVSLLSCFIPEIALPFGIGVMCTSIGDGFAGVFGQIKSRFNPKIYGEKTLFGGIANFVLSTVCALILSGVYDVGLSLGQCIFIGVLSCELELITGLGLDNISITWSTTALAYGFMYFKSMGNYIVPIILTPLIFAFAFKKRALTSGGLISAFILDIIISVSLGNFGFVLLSAFFMCSVFVDKIKKSHKNNGRVGESQKGDCRDYVQVLANGLVPGICAIAYLITKNTIFVVAFVASLAEAFADTTASGLGSLSDTAFDPFRWKSCDKGISGGMSIIGTTSSLVASLSISLIALVFGKFDFGITAFIVASVCGFLGCIFDSLLGSLVQIKYRCSVCDKLTEKELHCNQKTTKESGWALVDNDIVNITSTAFSSLAAVIIILLI